MRTFPILALALLVSACNSWPDEGRGGMAEIFPAPVAVAVNHDVARHLDCSLQYLSLLSDAAEQTGHASGRVAVLQMEAIRAQRELVGNLDADANRTLVRLDRDVALLAPDLPVPTLPPATLDPRHCTT